MPAPDARLRILLVEDDPDDAALFRRGLGARDVDLAVAGRLAEAFTQLEARPFDVVVTDLGLPDSQGFDTVARVRARCPHLALVVLSGRDDEQLAMRAVTEGAEDYLVKGELVEPMLFRALRQAVERKRTREQIQNLADALAEQNRQMLADLETARDVQAALLPHGNSLTNGRVKVHQSLLPAQLIGGDLFAVIPTSPDETTIVMFDVVGHGVRAALIASLLRALVAELPFMPQDPARVLTHLSRRLRHVLTDEPVFASAFCVVLRPLSESMRFSCAGHPIPWRLRPEEGQLDPMVVPVGPPLGMVHDPEYSTAVQPIDSGERLMLFTDGLYEVDGRDGSPLGKTGLETIVRRHIALGADAMADAVLRDVQAFAGRDTFEDDVCLLLAEVTE